MDLCPIGFYRALLDCAGLADCQRLFGDAIRPFGFNTFACGDIDPVVRQRVVFHMIDWPDSFRAYYLRGNLHERDPIIEAALDIGRPFTWTQLRAERRIAKIGTEALQTLAGLGYTEGLVVPISLSARHVALVSLAGNRTVDDDELQVRLSLISTALYHRARRLSQRDGFAAPPMGLTRRELDALEMVAQGKSDARIAQAQGVSKTTAHETVERAKRKMAASTRAEAVAIAGLFGMLNTQPL